MTTTAAASSSTTATSTSSTDDPPTAQGNDGSPSVRTDYDNGGRLNEANQNNHIRMSSDAEKNASKNMESTPSDSKSQEHTSHHSPDGSVTDTANTAATTVSPTTSSFSSSSTSSFSSSSSTLTTPSSAMPATKESNADVKNNQSPNRPTTNTSANNTEQKRPMNAFLLFCKRQRSLVREKHPNLENRGITKILGDWWTNLDKEQKSKYTDMARQHKEAFMKANPDFKWCKTPNVSNINNNNSNNNTGAHDSCSNNHSSEQKHQPSHKAQQQQQRHQPQNNFLYNHSPHQNHNMSTATNVDLKALQSVHSHIDSVHHHSSDSNTSIRQIEAPKPPKKRFLERNDSIYTSKDNSSSSNRQETSLHGADVVPCISLDQDTLDRVIDKAFSEDSNTSKPSGTNNSCKFSNRNTTNVTMSSSNSSNNPLSFSTATTTAATTTSTGTVYPMSVDEPVDFSMNRTINTTRQQIINNLVEKMLSEPSEDSVGNFPKLNGNDSNLKCYAGPPNKKDKPDVP